MKAVNIMNNEFPSAVENNNFVTLKLVWGVKDINKDDVGIWDPLDAGKIIYDDSFDMSSKEA